MKARCVSFTRIELGDSEGEFTSSRRCVSSWARNKLTVLFLISLNAISKLHVHVFSDWLDIVPHGYLRGVGLHIGSRVYSHILLLPFIPSGSSSLELGIRWVLTCLLCDWSKCAASVLRNWRYVTGPYQYDNKSVAFVMPISSKEHTTINE
jgi:hypothetical protein